MISVREIPDPTSNVVHGFFFHADVSVKVLPSALVVVR